MSPQLRGFTATQLHSFAVSWLSQHHRSQLHSLVTAVHSFSGFPAVGSHSHLGYSASGEADPAALRLFRVELSSF